MTGVAVPLLLALLQFDEMDILEHEPIEQHDEPFELEEDDADDADDPADADEHADDEPDAVDDCDDVDELEEKLEEAGLKRLRSLLGLETPSLL